MKNFLQHKDILIIILLIFIGGFLRFYNLNWGTPFYFHPDERNIASAISQLNFPSEMNPHFFAYGSFPIYIIYFFGIFWNLISFKFSSLANVTFENSILISRFLSALLSTLLIPLLYLIAKKIKNKNAGIFVSLLSTFSVGFIQFAHFGTFELWITFLSVSIFYLSLLFLNSRNKKLLVMIGFIFGLLIATKISGGSLFFYILFFILIDKIQTNRKLIFLIKDSVLDILIVFFPAIIIFLLISPFAFLDFGSFLSSLKYESSVALGTLPVFYTGEFYDKYPILFQLTSIYPFLLNPFLTAAMLPALFYVGYIFIKRKNESYLLLILMFLTLLSQAFLFAKWTRYMVPTLPFIYLIISLFVVNCLENKKNVIRIFSKIILLVLGISAIIFSFSYFKTAFINDDTRISAAKFAKQNISSNARIASEVYDLGIVSFNSFFPNITLFNFYDLDNNTPSKIEELSSLLLRNDYIILPSQRLMKTRLLNKQKFKNGNEFYSLLFNDKLGYRKVYEIPCDIFCKITYLGNPVFSFEETANVFDRPTVFIFKKISNE